MDDVEEDENSAVEHHGSSFGRGFSDAAGQRGPLTRIDHRKELDLSGRSLSYTAGLANTYVALTSLDISNNAVTRLDSLPTTLLHLNASHNLVRCISGLEQNYDLQTLNLAHNSITRVSGLDQCTNLVELSLQSNEIRVISDLECNLQLERIDLSHNGIPAVEALRTLSLNTKVTWMCLKGNPCARNSTHRHKLTGLLPNLLMLDDMRMPKSSYRPASPAARQAQHADGTPTRRAASPASARSSASKVPMRAAGDGEVSSACSSYEQGSVGSWAAAGAAGGALGPWNSMPAAAPVRTFGSMTATSATIGGALNGRRAYASSNRPPSPQPGVRGNGKQRPPPTSESLQDNYVLNNSKTSAMSDGGGAAWIAPNAKNVSPAVVAALAGRGRDASPAHAQAPNTRSSRQDMKFARMAAGLASNPSGVEKVDSAGKILESLSGMVSPTSRSGRSSQTASPQKGDARTIAQYAEDGRSHSGNTAPDAVPRRTGQGVGAEGGVHAGVEDGYSSLPRGGGGSPHKIPASAKVGAVASEMNGKIERLYECHVRSMDVIAQQQALLSTVHRDLRIVKSAVTYINAKMNGRNPAVAAAELATSSQDHRVEQMAEQLQDSLTELVEARGALVAAMRWADTAQHEKGKQDLMNFKQQVKSCSLLSSPGPEDGIKTRQSPSGENDGGIRGALMRVGEDPKSGTRAGQSPSANQESGAHQSSGSALDRPEELVDGHAHAFAKDSPPPARTPSMEGQSRHGRGSQDAHPNTSDQAHRDFAQPPSIEGTPSPSAAGASHGQAPVREPNAASRTPAKDAMEVGAARPPSSSRSGAVQQGIASPLKGNSPARSRGGSDGGHPEVMQRWTEEMLRTLEECQDETADELVTTRLALRNMVKLSRMPGCSKDKVDEYRRLLEECAVMTPYQLPPPVSQVEHLEGHPGAPDILQSVMDAVRDLNLAKTALGKMMGLMESPDVGREQLAHYALVIEETLLAQADQ